MACRNRCGISARDGNFYLKKIGAGESGKSKGSVGKEDY